MRGGGLTKLRNAGQPFVFPLLFLLLGRAVVSGYELVNGENAA